MEVIPKLGAGNVLYVLYYRLLSKWGILTRRFPIRISSEEGQIFAECPSAKGYIADWKDKLIPEADHILKGYLPYYSNHSILQTTPPDWFINRFNAKECTESNNHWTRISDFNKSLGDIKNVWELSRFSWVGPLARAYAVSGNKVYLDTLNLWLSDWISKNPLNQGPNWKCGQEASFRLMNLLNAAHILSQSETPTSRLKSVIEQHLERISLNIRYAFSQRNNHASSEAAALFIGGNWLLIAGSSGSEAAGKYAKIGRKALERKIEELSYDDGSFAQHSTNYHRLFLDTLSSVLFWTNRLKLQKFSDAFYENADKSLDWLLALVDSSGNCPNLGSNDGTLLLGNHSCEYLDYRPSLQLASALLRGRLVFESGPYDEALYWFGVNKTGMVLQVVQKRSHLFSSGYLVMSAMDSWALLRFPNYKFRPSHNDVFHFDLWADGRNLLFDSGSYSYNPDKGSMVPDLKSVRAHNTLSFDQQEQMPRLSRFLLGRWIKPVSIGNFESADEHSGSWIGSYKDYKGNMHMRSIKWTGRNWTLHDTFAGKAKCVELGFSFDVSDYDLNKEENLLVLPWGRIIVSPNATLEVMKHAYSLHYNEIQEGHRLLILSANNSEITTSIFLK